MLNVSAHLRQCPYRMTVTVGYASTTIVCVASTRNLPKALALGAELRDARKAKGYTLAALGAKIGRSHDQLSRIERGQLGISVEDVATVLGVLDVQGQRRDEILQLARDAANPNWVAPGVTKHLAMLTDYERAASRIVNVEPLLIPGLLQTMDYARSVMTSAGASPGEAEQRATHRMGRQNILTRARPVQFEAYIGEQALRYPPCDRTVMVEQLQALLKWSRMEHVTIRALPFDGGYSPALEGPFILLEFEKGPSVVQLEHYRSATTLTERRDVSDYMSAVDTIRRQAMSPAATEGLIAKLSDEVEST
jgi:transcriptional regulator with XRE-family HTH domain